MLFVHTVSPGKGEPVNYNTFSAQLKKIAKKAGIKKRIHMHLFRHSRATILGKLSYRGSDVRVFRVGSGF